MPSPAKRQGSATIWKGALLIDPTPRVFSLPISYLALDHRKGKAEEESKSSP